MYNAFRSLGGFKLLTLLVIIQLALGISLLDNVAMQLMGVINKRDVYTEMFDVNNTYMIRVRNAVSWVMRLWIWETVVIRRMRNRSSL